MYSAERLNVLAITAEQAGDAVRRVVLPLARLCEAHPDAISARFAPGLSDSEAEGVDLLLVRAAELPDIKSLVDARTRGAKLVVDLAHLPWMTPRNLGPGDTPTSLNPQLGLALSIADLVLVSSAGLTRHAAPFNQRIAVCETYIDSDLWNVPRPALTADDPIALCWLGGPNAAFDHAPLGDSLRRLFEERPACGLVSFCDLPAHVEPSTNVWRQPLVPYLELPRFLAGVSIGIVPRADNIMSTVSTPAMIIEFLALGIPVVASPTPGSIVAAEKYPDVRIANTPDEWLDTLRELATEARKSRVTSAPEYHSLKANLDSLGSALFACAGRKAPWMTGGSA